MRDFRGTGKNEPFETEIKTLTGATIFVVSPERAEEGVVVAEMANRMGHLGTDGKNAIPSAVGVKKKLFVFVS